MSSRSEVLVIGGGGHARSVIDLLLSSDVFPLGFYDQEVRENENILHIKGYHIDQLPEAGTIVLAIGSNEQRVKYFSQLYPRILKKNIVHASSIMGSEVKAGNSNLFFPRVTLNAYSEIGDNNIINTGAIIEHECSVGSGCHISVGAIICGRVKIGNNCFIGAGSVLRDGIAITDNVTIGAGSVVVKNIMESGVYAGNPAKKIK